MTATVLLQLVAMGDMLGIQDWVEHQTGEPITWDYANSTADGRSMWLIRYAYALLTK